MNQITFFPVGQVWAISPGHFVQRLEQIETVGPEGIRAAAARASNPAKLVDNRAGVGIIRVRGVMEKYPSIIGAIFGDTSTIGIRRALAEAAADKKVKTILMSIDSPGGVVDGMADLEDAVNKARMIKPVIAQVDGEALSAGYWLASQADRIYAGRLDTVGSIGVRASITDYSKMFKDDGVKRHAVDTGEYKSMGLVGTEVTENHLKYLQGLVDKAFDHFKSAVMNGRNMTKEDLEPRADGRIFYADDARKKGLIDGIQNFEGTFGGLVQSKQGANYGRAARLKTAIEIDDALARVAGQKTN